MMIIDTFYHVNDTFFQNLIGNKTDYEKKMEGRLAKLIDSYLKKMDSNINSSKFLTSPLSFIGYHEKYGYYLFSSSDGENFFLESGFPTDNIDIAFQNTLMSEFAYEAIKKEEMDSSKIKKTYFKMFGDIPYSENVFYATYAMNKFSYLYDKSFPINLLNYYNNLANSCVIIPGSYFDYNINNSCFELKRAN